MPSSFPPQSLLSLSMRRQEGGLRYPKTPPHPAPVAPGLEKAKHEALGKMKKGEKKTAC